MLVRISSDAVALACGGEAVAAAFAEAGCVVAPHVSFKPHTYQNYTYIRI